MSTASTYLLLSKNLDRWRGMAAKKPSVALETKHFTANVGKATSIDALLKDRRVFNYAMKAFGLGDRTDALGLMRKVLAQGVDNPKDVARKLNDANILEFATAFDYAGKTVNVDSTDFVKAVTARYIEKAMESQQGESNPGIELALYFRDRAPKLKSVYGVLADRKLLEVVQTALNIPVESLKQSIDTQARLLGKKLKVDDFKDPKKLDAFISRFAALYDVKNPGAENMSSKYANALLYGSDQPAELDLSVLLRRQNAAQGF